MSEKHYMSLDNAEDLVTQIGNKFRHLGNPMVYKGTLGNNATISTLPSASTENEGFTYKVITAGTYASQAAKVGDVFISTGSEWTLIPAGDEDSDTWRGIKVNGTEKLGNGISSGSADFIDGTYVKASFNATGNKFSFDITPAQSITESGSGLVTAGLVYTYIDTMITQALTGSY